MWHVLGWPQPLLILYHTELYDWNNFYCTDFLLGSAYTVKQNTWRMCKLGQNHMYMRWCIYGILAGKWPNVRCMYSVLAGVSSNRWSHTAMYVGLARTVHIHCIIVYDRIFGDFPAKNAVHTPYIHTCIWPTLHKWLVFKWPSKSLLILIVYLEFSSERAPGIS